MAVDLDKWTMGLRGDEPIKGWIVVFMTPFGAFANYGDAKRKVDEVGELNPNLCIFPVPAAISESGKFEIVSR